MKKNDPTDRFRMLRAEIEFEIDELTERILEQDLGPVGRALLISRLSGLQSVLAMVIAAQTLSALENRTRDEA